MKRSGLAPCLVIILAAAASAASAQTLSVSDVTVTEGSSGPTMASFQVSLSAPSTQTVTVNYATSDGTARAGAFSPQIFSNTAAISIPANSRTASAYPATISVPVLPGRFDRVSVTLHNFSSSFAGSWQALLVGPAGQKVQLLAPSGNTTAVNVQATFDDNGTQLTNWVTGTYRPPISSSASFPNNAPAQPYSTVLSVFNGAGATAAGTWSLYLALPFATSETAGSVAGGWSITFGPGDYEPTSGTLTFPAGSTAPQTVNVPVTGDVEVEPDETFVLTLSNATGATIADGAAAAIIANDDTRVRITSFVVDPAIVGPGPVTSKLTWTTADATDVLLSGNPNPLSANGEASVTVQGTTTFTLTARGQGNQQAQAMVTLVLLPQPGSASQSLGFPQITSPATSERVFVSGVSFAWTAVSGAAGYDLRIFDGYDGRTVFSGSLQGSASTSTLITLPPGLYLFGVRPCTSGGFLDFYCGSYAMRDFTVDPVAPSSPPTVLSHASGTNYTASTQTFTWSPVAKALDNLPLFYDVLLEDIITGATALQVTVPDPETSTVASIGSTPLYRLRVRACQARCGPYSSAVNFGLTLGSVPTAAPAITGASLSGNNLTVSWSSVPGADLYQIQVIQPGAGPGGGALTVAARQVSTTTATFPVPSGQANVLVTACNGDACGPPSAAFPVNATAPNPNSANLGTPLAGSIVAGPVVNFSWSRIPGDNGSNTTYRLFVQDLSRQAPALDVRTTTNFYAAHFKAEGSRYDALVIADPAGQAITGPALGFTVRGVSSAAPTLVQPAHNSSQQQGNLQLGWSPIPGATLYEYYVAVQGIAQATLRGVTPGLVVQVPLAIAGGFNTFFSGIVRACPALATCQPGSSSGWGPWSVDAGPGVTNFTVTP